LEAGRDLGLETGGWAPKLWMTLDGPQPELLQGFGLTECKVTGYPPRTRMNVLWSDGTVVFGKVTERGSALTVDCCRQSKKPVLIVPFPGMEASIAVFRAWLYDRQIGVLNVAGNCESHNPRIQEFVRKFLVEALRKDEE